MPPSFDPKLSVIVVCRNNASVLEQCLAALTAQSESCDVEILAMGRWDSQKDNRGLRVRYSQVRWITVPDDCTVPLMRMRGIAQSRGAIIALLEDDCVAANDWCSKVIAAHQSAYDAIGGPIEPSDGYKNLDWGNYFCEYGRFMMPFSGEVSALPGNNVSYKRIILSDLRKNLGLYEVFFHWQLQQSGKTLFADTGLVVYNVNHWSRSHLTTSPFHHGRAFAGMRAQDLTRWRRRSYAVLAIGLPLLKIIRIARELIRRKRYLRHFLLSLPWITLFMLSWSFGEFLGYVFGAGESASRWQ